MNVFKVYFDGGFNGCLYGSWEVEYNGFRKRISREMYERTLNPGTCNVAEYEALISALKWIQSVKGKENYKVEIWGDSRLVVEQVRKSWRTKKEHLQVRRDRVRWLLLGFKDWSIHWHPRRNSVARFGH